MVSTARPASERESLMFLPGASGNTQFWQPVAAALSQCGPQHCFGWPGFAGVPHDPTVTGLSDLVERVVGRIASPTILLAQSMGGVIALRAALRRPNLVRALILAVTSGGIDVRALGGVDWRPEFAAKNPDTPRWFLEARDDITRELARITIPTLLLFGDADPIAPVAVGQRLAELLPNAELVIFPGGTHDLVSERTPEVVAHIERHLERVTSASR